MLKTDSLFAVVAAIRAVVQGEPWYSPRIQGEVYAWLRGAVAAPPVVARLTAREREVLRYVARGDTNARIAKELGIVERTVGFHVSNILKKVEVPSRVAAALWAKEQGLVS